MKTIVYMLLIIHLIFLIFFGFLIYENGASDTPTVRLSLFNLILNLSIFTNNITLLVLEKKTRIFLNILVIVLTILAVIVGFFSSPIDKIFPDDF